MKIPFKTKKQEEVSEVSNEEKVAQALEKMAQAAEEQDRKLADLAASHTDLVTKVADLQESSTASSEKTNEDNAELKEAQTKVAELQQKVDEYEAQLSDKANLFSEWFETLSVEDKVKLRDAINQGIPEAEKEDTARVAEDVGDPELADSLDNVANPQDYRWAERMSCFVNIKT